MASADAGANTTIRLQTMDNGDYLFLPSSADLPALALRFPGGTATVADDIGYVQINSGGTFNLYSIASGDGP